MEEREGIAVFRCLFDMFWGAAAAIDLHVSEKLILPREREHENQAFWQHQSLQEYFCSM